MLECGGGAGSCLALCAGGRHGGGGAGLRTNLPVTIDVNWLLALAAASMMLHITLEKESHCFKSEQRRPCFTPLKKENA